MLALPKMAPLPMFDGAPGSAVNARASWLAGRPVHGDVLLSYTKIRHTRWLVPAVVASSDFTEEVFWQWLHGLLPEVEHVDRGAHSLISRLPHIYRWDSLTVAPCIACNRGEQSLHMSTSMDRRQQCSLQTVLGSSSLAACLPNFCY